MGSEVKLIQSIARAFEIIECFNSEKWFLTIKEISKKVDLNINTTRGIVNTLVYFGYLEHDEEKNVYSLGQKFNYKTEMIKHNLSYTLVNVAKEHLTPFANKYDVSCRIQLVTKNNVYTVENIRNENATYVILLHDTYRLYLHASASGKLSLLNYSNEKLEEILDGVKFEKLTKNTITSKSKLLAEVESIRERGYSTENSELVNGLSSIAFPIYNTNEKIIATLSVSAPTVILENDREKMTKELAAITRKVNQELLHYSSF